MHELFNLKERGIEYIVAPYEADAQLAFLSLTKTVSGIISEDSDLLPYGCQMVLFKLDSDGNGKEIQLSKLNLNLNPNFDGFSHEMFRQLCILSGCDYLSPLQNFGLMRAHNLFREFKTIDQIFAYLKKTKRLPETYPEEFEKAEKTFLYQRVYDPFSKSLVHLNPLPPHLNSQELDFLGPEISPMMAAEIASGKVLLDNYNLSPSKNYMSHSNKILLQTLKM